MQALILAGGRAERLQNKLSLPILADKPLISSSLDAATTLSTSVRVIMNRDDALMAWVLNRYPSVEIFTDQFAGILACLKGFTPCGQDTMVFHGDNIYPVEQPLTGIDQCVVRKIIDPDKQLDQWNGKEWKERGMDDSDLKLCSPWIISAESISLIKSHFGLIKWMNHAKLQGLKRQATGWWDLGTENAYHEYWKSIKRTQSQDNL